MLFLLVLLYNNNVFAVNNTDVELLMHLIEQFCPSSNVCPEYINYAPAISNGFLSSCCKACSCSADCEKNYNCCFPDKKYDVQDDVRDDLKQTTFSCLRAATFEPMSNLYSNIRAYTMVSDVTGSGNTSCADISVAIWGSLHPVFSSKTKLIYKNSACAHAHDVTDGVLWNALISCDQYDVQKHIKADLNSFVAALENQTLPYYCQVIFEYPGQMDDIAQHACYKDLIDSCPNTDFSLASLSELNVSKKFIREFCSSGLLAPYFRQKQIYVNVFCYICHGNEFSPEMKCFYTADRDMYKNTFVGLIDPNVVSNQAKMKLKFPHACLKSGSVDSNCRPLLCPAGQIRTPPGDCKYFSSTWQVQPIAVHLNLTSTVALNMTELLTSRATTLEDLTFLSNPWPDPWKLFSLSFDYLEAEYTKTIFVSLRKFNDNSSKKPVRIIRNIIQNLEKPWILSNRPLRSKFAKFFSISAEHPDVLNYNRTHILTRKYKIVGQSRSEDTTVRFYVNKLHICDQVELDASEFELSFDNTVLYNKVAGCFLWDGEFSIIRGTDGFKARICLDGSGFVAARGRISLQASMPIVGSVLMSLACFVLRFSVE